MYPLKFRKAAGECPQPRVPSRSRPKSLPQTQESNLLRAFHYARDNYGQYLSDLATVERLRVQYGPEFDYVLERLTNLRDMLPDSVQTTTQNNITNNHTFKQPIRDKLMLPNTKSSCYLRLGCDTTPVADTISLGKKEVKIATSDGIISIKSQILTQG